MVTLSNVIVDFYLYFKQEALSGCGFYEVGNSVQLRSFHQHGNVRFRDIYN